jgi:hypothetical protein
MCTDSHNPQPAHNAQGITGERTKDIRIITGFFENQYKRLSLLLLHFRRSFSTRISSTNGNILHLWQHLPKPALSPAAVNQHA